MNKFNITHTDYSEEIRNAMEAGLILPAGGDRVHIVNMEDISGTYSYAEINDLLNNDEEFHDIFMSCYNFYLGMEAVPSAGSVKKAEIVNISIDDLPLTA